MPDVTIVSPGQESNPALMTGLGITILIAGFVFFVAALAYGILKDKNKITAASCMIFFVFAVTSFLFLNSAHIAKVAVPNLGTIELSAQHAVEDAGAISVLKTKIENQSATIDMVAAQSQSASQKASEADIAVVEAKKNVEELKDLVHKSQDALFNLTQLEQNIQLVMAAQNDSRKAFDILGQKASNVFDPFHEQAGMAYVSIYNAHNEGLVPRFNIQWNDGINIDKMSLDELSDLYDRNGMSSTQKAAIIQKIQERNDIQANDKLEFYVGVIKDDESLLAVETATRAFDPLTGNVFGPLATQKILNWWAASGSDWEKAHAVKGEVPPLSQNH